MYALSNQKVTSLFWANLYINAADKYHVVAAWTEHRSATTKMSAFGQHGLAFQVYVIFQLVMLLNISVFLVLAGRQKTGQFVAMKAQNGSVLCATSTPNSKTLVRSKLDCYRSCVESMGRLCASGANYRMKEKLCEMYSILPVDYQVDPDCEFYQVGLI